MVEKNWVLTNRQLCDLELLLDGSFSPLEGFICQSDYNSILKDGRLGNGKIWPMPITLDVNEQFSKNLDLGDEVVLKNTDGTNLARLTVEDIFEPNKEVEAEAVFQTQDTKHPGAEFLFNQAGNVYLGGKVKAENPFMHNDFVQLRRTPTELQSRFEKKGWSQVIAFQTRNPLHQVHQELIARAMEKYDARALIHPVVGLTKPGDVDHYSRVRCYKHMLTQFPSERVELSLLNLAMRMAGPKEALWHALIRKNYGCSHLIVGRDHAGPGVDSSGKPFYGPYDAQELVARHEDELGIKMIPFEELVYSKSRSSYVQKSEALSEEIETISGTQVREKLARSESLPPWFTFNEVAEELKQTYKAKRMGGKVIFFTGLSGSGKSTIANRLRGKLLELSPKPITMLDGDIVRRHLSKGLGFSKEDRDANILRIGFVASEIARHGADS